MFASQKLDLQGQSVSLKLGFTSLIDSMRFSHRIEQLQDQSRMIEHEKTKKSLSLDKLFSEISLTIQNTKDDLGEEDVLELSRQIPSFAKIAIDQIRKKVEDRAWKSLQENESLVASEKTKLLKSLEAFLATSPIPILEVVIKQSFIDGAYNAKSIYRCTDDIQYEFSLDTKKSPLFGGELRLSAFEKEVKLPISLGKSLLKKEPTPEYERLDQYILTSTETSEGHLIADFSHPDKEAKVRIVYARQGSNSAVMVTFKDTEREVNVTSESSLNRFFRSELIERAMDRIWLATVELERNKLALNALTCNGENVLSHLDCADFFTASWKLIAPAVSKTLKNNKAGYSTSGLTESFVRDKIKLLGESGSTILLMLGLTSS